MFFINIRASSCTITFISIKSLTFTRSQDKKRQIRRVITDRVKQNNNDGKKNRREEKRMEKDGGVLCVDTKAKSDSRHDNDFSVECEGRKRIKRRKTNLARRDEKPE